MAVQLTAENFESEVIRSAEPVMVDFYAPWCGPCRGMMPAVDLLAEKFEGRVKVRTLNIDQARDIRRHYGIRSIPFFAFFQEGKLVDSVQGTVPPIALEERLERLV